MTGGAAGDFDVNELSASGGDRAEKRALPLTLAILAVAFGTLVAAGLPFLMGLATTTVALGAAFLLAKIVTVSNLLGNVVTMVGLAIGIDYSLLMVTHYREHARQSTVALTVAGTVADAAYLQRLGLSDPPASAGYAFTLARRYVSPAQADALQAMLDRLQALNLIAWERFPSEIEITVASDASQALVHGP